MGFIAGAVVAVAILFGESGTWMFGGAPGGFGLGAPRVKGEDAGANAPRRSADNWDGSASEAAGLSGSNGVDAGDLDASGLGRSAVPAFEGGRDGKLTRTVSRGVALEGPDCGKGMRTVSFFGFSELAIWGNRLNKNAAEKSEICHSFSRKT
jgi:hypothetical protein